MVKMTPNISDMVSVARACLDAGANALAISNSIRGFAGVTWTQASPFFRLSVDIPALRLNRLFRGLWLKSHWLSPSLSPL